MRERYTLLMTGEKYFINFPEECSFDLRALATGMARTCRFNGQFSKFEDDIYAVAQHSVLVDDLVNHIFGVPRARGWAIMHDAPEGIIGDLISPVKALCPEFSSHEDRMAGAMRSTYGVEYDAEVIKVVHKADLMACAMEAEALTDIPASEWGLSSPPISMEQMYPNWRPWGVKEGRDLYEARVREIFNME